MAKILPLSSNRATQRSAHSQNHRDYDAIADLWKKSHNSPPWPCSFRSRQWISRRLSYEKNGYAL